MSHSTRQIEPNMQKRHTNIAVVRVKKAGKRFELACYKNKILNWRSGVETNVEDVLQIKDVFKDVSNGERVNKKEMQKVFGTNSILEVMKYILDKGDLQLSKKEREHIFNMKWREIVVFLSDQCLNPVTKRPYTYGFIEREMKSMHFSVHPFKNTKMQALKCLKKLKGRIDIIRARMKISIKYERIFKKEIQSFIKNNVSIEFIQDSTETTSKNVSEEERYLEFKCWVDPGSFRILREKIEDCGGKVKMLMTGLEESENKLIDISRINESTHFAPQKKQQRKKIEDTEDHRIEDNSGGKKQKTKTKKNRKNKNKKRRFDASSEEEEEKSVANEIGEEDDLGQGKKFLTKQEKRKLRREKRKRKQLEKKAREKDGHGSGEEENLAMNQNLNNNASRGGRKKGKRNKKKKR